MKIIKLIGPSRCFGKLEEKFGGNISANRLSGARFKGLKLQLHWMIATNASELDVCSFIKTFTATTRCEALHVFSWLWSFFVFVRPLFVAKTMNYGTKLLVGGWDNFLIRLPLWLFLRDPYSILVSSPENLLPIFYSSTKISVKSFPEANTALSIFRAVGYFSFL